ncbi:MAG TPA: hypothetical protein DIT67_01195 [Octadecabacter sp.]|nr:hypothetical protein [Octadecabacter sp.]
MIPRVNLPLAKADDSSAIIVNGSVYAAVTEVQARSRVEVSVGAISAPLNPSSNNPLSTYAMDADTPLDVDHLAAAISSDPKEKVPGEIYTVWVNHLTDWVMAGTQTVQLMMTKRDTPSRIEIERTINIEAAAAGLVFETRLAQHRGRANLLIHFTCSQTQCTTSHSIAFDPAFQGGIAPENYQHVRIPLPEDFETGQIWLAIDYLEYVPDGHNVEPFFFLADTRVSVPSTPSTSLVDPIRIGKPGEERTKVWMEGDIPSHLMSGDEIRLSIGGNEQILLNVTPPAFTLKEDYGHTLVIESDQAVELLLVIDGAPVEQVNFGASHNVVRLPSKFLTGTTRHLCFKDRSGSITYWETQHLAPAIITPADVLQRETAAPFPSTVFSQTPRRYASLKAHMENADPSVDMAQVAYAMSVLEGGHDNVKLKPLTFTRPDTPKVTVVIPAHNKVEVTYLALCSLLVAHNHASFEVIVIDDASSDETRQLEDIVNGITVLHNDTAQRFIRACNRGAAEAKGDFIALLNNDVEVTSGWLDELLDAFDRFENVGLAGAKLLYPNGALQDAGGIVWGTGNPWNYGNSQNPEDPRFSYARQADYLSGAAMMVPADLWRALDGFSSYMEPMYFEDTDFAFKVREAGYSTWFVPSSVVYHFEGMTSGTDVTTGFKKYQEVNRPKFKRRWAKDFAKFGKEGSTPDLEKDRGIVGRVLFIDYSTPRPDQDAGSYAALQEIRLVQSLGYKVSFLPSNMAHLGSYTEELQKMGVEMIYAPFYLSQSEYLAQHAADFDAFYITRYYVARDVLSQLRKLAPEARVIFNNADLHFLREIRAAQSENDAVMLEKARQTRTDEMDIINNVDVVLSYNDVEHSVIQAYSDGAAKVVKCPWVVDVPDMRMPLSRRSGLSFLGSFRHHPNSEGVLWFIRDVLPAVVNSTASPINLSIYGAAMSDDIKALASDTVHPVGFVENISDAYDNHRIFVAPLRSGAGIKGKVLSALAHGIPCVLSPTAAEGIGLRNRYDCFIVNTPSEWASAIARLNEDDDLWHAMSANAQAYMRDAFSFTQGRAQMRAAFEAADLYNTVD